MNFKTALGTDVVQTIKFKNFVKKPTVYQVKIEKLGGAAKTSTNPKDTKAPQCEFTVDNLNVNAPAADSKDGVEVPLNIKFEPSGMSESKALMTVSSTEGGTYQYYLIGQTVNPQPKGPFKNTGKGGISIDFKNPFYEATEFMVRIDNPAFTTTVKNPMKLEAGKVGAIPVTYKAVPGQTANGRVIVSAEGVPQWTFYVQGD